MNFSPAQVPITNSVIKRVAIIPIQEDIEPALVYIVRRAIKEAKEKKADAIILHMDTNGGRVDSTTEIINILSRFEPQNQTYTLIDTKAFSAGAFISAATRHIYMTPGSVIGAATPILSTGQEMPKSIEEKMTSAVRALVRATAERHGHNTKVFEAMIDRDQGLTVDGKEIVPKGKILTLTAQEAEKKYGKPPRPLLSAGTVDSLEQLLKTIGAEHAERIEIQATGFEILARWVVKISPILLLIGIVGVYVELKTPGLGLPGLFAAICLLLFFFGHYIAGLSGHEAFILFILGVILLLTEILIFPGTILPGVLGVAFIMISLILAMVDKYPADPMIPTITQLQTPLLNFSIALIGGIIVIGLLARFLPASPLFKRLTLETASGTQTPFTFISPSRQIGETGIALTPLKPSGKGQFGETIEEITSAGEFIEARQTIRIVEITDNKIIVEKV
ncbi:MAG: ATP-dependent Clp protease proteolytic subunit [Verrucomicrobiae bacterium]|nr:ATP-dependent Clp protease proteolytic subunit [Verrucomicrobiae bacterium]